MGDTGVVYFLYTVSCLGLQEADACLSHHQVKEVVHSGQVTNLLNLLQICKPLLRQSFIISFSHSQQKTTQSL